VPLNIKHASATLEQRNNGSRDSTWWNAGFRPVYFINDNLRFVTEVGHSEVLSTTKSLTLTRLTFAYEIAINKSIWARPVIRAYATESFWSKDNRSNFNNKKDGHAVGFQTEVWF
jgi:maltoporin